MKFRKIGAALAAFCLVGCSLPVGFPCGAEAPFVASAEEGEYTEGKSGSFSYKKYSDRVEISNLEKPTKKVEIPAEIDSLPVTSIGGSAFLCCTGVESVVIPDGVTIIHENAFYGCSSLKSITIPESVEEICGNSVFEGTPWLEEKRKENPFVTVNGILIDCKGVSGDVTIPDGIRKIGQGALSYSENLESVKIPGSVGVIGAEAFWGCMNLKTVEISDGVESLERGAFCYCENLETVRISGNLKIVGDIAFYGCSSLRSLNLPDSVTSIGEKAFCQCEKLESFRIPKNVTVIENSTFSDCLALESVDIPDGMTEICESAFEACSSLKAVTIPKKVRKIGYSAFAVCDSLESVTIENPDCEILYDRPDTISNGLDEDFNHLFTGTIYGCYGSTAETFARGNGYNFSVMEFTPSASLLGDANCDGEVTIADATAIVQFIGNPDRYPLDETALKNADCYNTGDGVTPLDAYAIQLLEAGSIKSLPYNG